MNEIKRIAFAGAQDTGKTTIAKELSSRFKTRNYITEYIDEAARFYVGRWRQPIMGVADQLFLIDKQLDKEQAIAPKCQIVFYDSPLFLGYAYTLLNWNDIKTVRDIDMLVHIYEKILINGRYDLIFYLKPFRVPVDDGIRTKALTSQNSKIDLMIKSYLDLHNLEYVTIDATTVAERIETIDVMIKKFLSYEDKGEQHGETKGI